MNKNFFFISGLPRSGSTLLSTILYQNPEIHTEGNSAVCQLMWDLIESCNNYSYEPLMANNRWDSAKNIISSIPNIYYSDIDRPIIFDKSRTWTLPSNFDIIKNFINNDPKIIVLVRNIDDIIKSFLYIRKKNNIVVDISKELLLENTDPLMRPLDGVIWSMNNNKENNFLFISYNNLIKNTEKEIRKIYDFINVKYFKHDLTNIYTKNPENDDFYGIKGMHDVRPNISIRQYFINLDNDIIKKCEKINKKIESLL